MRNSSVFVPNKPTLPQLPPDPVIELQTKERTEYGSYDKVIGSVGNRDITTRKAIAITYRDTTMALNGQKISHGQLMVLGDPDWEKNVAAYEVSSRGCRRGRPVFLFGLLGTVVGLIGLPVGGAILGKPGVIGATRPHAIFKSGQSVMAKWSIDNQYYRATIIRANPDGSYEVKWVSDGKKVTVPASDVRR